MNFDLVDVNDFGHAFNEGIEEAGLEEAKRQLETARDRAERDVRMRQAVLSQADYVEGTFELDEAWRRLTAKADRLEQVRYAVLQKFHMVRAMAQAQRQDGPRLYQVTQAECQQKKDANDRAVADVTTAKKNALDFGPDLPDVREHVDYLAKLAAVGNAEYQLAVKQLAYNEKRQAVMEGYDSLLAAARKLCAARTDGDRLCLGLLLKLERESFEPLATAYNSAGADVNGAIKHLAAVRAPTSGPTPSASASYVPTASVTSPTLGQASLSTSTSATAHYQAADNQLVAVPHFRSTGAHRGPAAVDIVGPPRLRGLVHEQFQAVRLTQLAASWAAVFGPSRAVCQQMALLECIANGDNDGNEESIVLHACLLRPEVTAVHIRLLMRYLGYPTVAWVKRGHSYRRGPREDCAWIKFCTLDDARDCKWRWDGMGHWGLTAWDEWNNIPRPLHFSFATHPDYKGLKQ